jgi:tetratricopeptide (TPR) repeat protein
MEGAVRKAFLILAFLFIISLLLGSLNCARKTADDHFKVGTRFFAEGDYDKAIQEYHEAIRIDPNHISSHLNLGEAYYQKGMYEEAKGEYEYVLRLNNMHPKAHYNLGRTLAQEGKKEEAKEHYEFLKSVKSNLADKLLEFIEKE